MLFYNVHLSIHCKKTVSSYKTVSNQICKRREQLDSWYVTYFAALSEKGCAIFYAIVPLRQKLHNLYSLGHCVKPVSQCELLENGVTPWGSFYSLAQWPFFVWFVQKRSGIFALHVNEWNLFHRKCVNSRPCGIYKYLKAMVYLNWIDFW